MGYPSNPVVTDTISVSGATDTYATHWAYLGKGGHRTVSTLTVMQAIPTARREFGMLITVVADPTPANNKTYQLSNIALGGVSDTLSDNSNFIEYAPGGSPTLTQSITAGNTTQAPSSDAVKTYVDGVAVGLLDDRGNYDASSNLYPTTGGSGPAGAVAKGDIWYISVGGTLGINVVTAGFTIRALTDTPAQIDANWAVSDSGLGYTPENQANKSTNNALGTSDVLYPSQKAVKEYVDNSQTNIKKGTFGAGFLKGINFINVGDTVTITMPASGQITGWQIEEVSDTPIAGDIVIDVFKGDYATYPPTVSIAGTELPTLTTSIKAENLTIPSWTPGLLQGDKIKFKVLATSNVKNVVLTIFYTKL